MSDTLHDRAPRGFFSEREAGPAVAEQTTTPSDVLGAAPTGFGVALDPFRPTEVLPPPGIAAMPPQCPMCRALLHPVNQNGAGDVLFECMREGYEAVYRVSTETWEPRPSRDQRRWAPPVFKVEPKNLPAEVLPRPGAAA